MRFENYIANLLWLAVVGMLKFRCMDIDYAPLIWCTTVWNGLMSRDIRAEHRPLVSKYFGGLSEKFVKIKRRQEGFEYGWC